MNNLVLVACYKEYLLNMWLLFVFHMPFSTHFSVCYFFSYLHPLDNHFVSCVVVSPFLEHFRVSLFLNVPFLDMLFLFKCLTRIPWTVFVNCFSLYHLFRVHFLNICVCLAL